MKLCVVLALIFATVAIVSCGNPNLDAMVRDLEKNVHDLEKGHKVHAKADLEEDDKTPITILDPNTQQQVEVMVKTPMWPPNKHRIIGAVAGSSVSSGVSTTAGKVLADDDNWDLDPNLQYIGGGVGSLFGSSSGSSSGYNTEMLVAD